jgi:uncharacterized membrane protein
MAGIGFELNKILSRENYTATLQAYTYAAMVSCGPWLMAVSAIGLLALVLRPFERSAEIEMFFVAISMIYATTLVLTGPVQLVLTRYAADQEFEQRPERIFPAFVFCLAWVTGIFSVLGLTIFVGLVPGPLPFRLAAALVMVLVGDTWVASVFLTAVKKYTLVLMAFAGGSLVSFVSGWALAGRYELGGAMIGFGLGQTMLLVTLCAAIFREMGNWEPIPKGLLRFALDTGNWPWGGSPTTWASGRTSSSSGGWTLGPRRSRECSMPRRFTIGWCISAF